MCLVWLLIIRFCVGMLVWLVNCSVVFRLLVWVRLLKFRCIVLGSWVI